MTDIRVSLKRLAKRGAKFDLISADPPWNYRDKALSGNRGAAAKYKGGTMTIKDLMDMGPLIEAVSATDCVLLIWGTWPLEDDCRKLIDAWGFQKKSVAFVWVKLNKVADTLFVGMGNYTRSNTEYVLVGVRKRGKALPRMSKAVQQVIISHVRENSRKPDEYFDRVDALYGTGIKRLELFGRQKRKGWTVLGDEVDKF